MEGRVHSEGVAGPHSPLLLVTSKPRLMATSLQPLPLWPCDCPPLHACVFTWPSYKATCHGNRATLIQSDFISTHHTWKDLVSKYGLIPRFQGLGPEHLFLGDTLCPTTVPCMCPQVVLLPTEPRVTLQLTWNMKELSIHDSQHSRLHAWGPPNTKQLRYHLPEVRADPTGSALPQGLPPLQTPIPSPSLRASSNQL